jgi:hypothetical protein
MPVTWTISHPARLVIAVVKDEANLADMQQYLDAVVVADALSYRKIFDLSNGALDLTDQDMMALGARIRAYASTSTMGPLAIVAASPQAYERARFYSTLADADRPLQIFRELHLARKWLDAQETKASSR